MAKYYKNLFIIILSTILLLIPKSSNIKIEDEFVKLEDRNLEFNDLFSISLDKYLVLFYSSSCISCRDTLKYLNSLLIKNNLSIYSIDINTNHVNFSPVKICNVGVNNVDDFYIYSYPTLSFIKESSVEKEVFGFENIRKENLYIFFE